MLTYVISTARQTTNEITNGLGLIKTSLRTRMQFISWLSSMLTSYTHMQTLKHVSGILTWLL